MMLHNEPSYGIYFGNKQDVLIKQGARAKKQAFSKEDFCEEGFSKIQKNLRLNSLVFLKQVHGVDGVCIDTHTPLIPSFNLLSKDGDMLITHRKAVGIGVISADCLPIVIYDPVQSVIAAIHAGWRGTLENIAAHTLKAMQRQYGCRPEDMIVYFGPSAKVCCYEIQNQFLNNLEGLSFAKDVVRRNDQKIYLNVPLINKYQLFEQGVQQNSLREQYHECTMCEPLFHSYRREGVYAGAQATVAFLK